MNSTFMNFIMDCLKGLEIGKIMLKSFITPLKKHIDIFQLMPSIKYSFMDVWIVLTRLETAYVIRKSDNKC